MTSTNEKRERAAIHQAGHALILVSKEIFVNEVVLPDDVPNDTTDLTLSLSEDHLWNTESLNELYAIILGGLEAERRVSDPNAGPHDDWKLGKELDTHASEWLGKSVANFLHRFPVNNTAGREIARIVIAQKRDLLNEIVQKLTETGSITWAELLSLEHEHRRRKSTDPEHQN